MKRDDLLCTFCLSWVGTGQLLFVDIVYFKCVSTRFEHSFVVSWFYCMKTLFLKQSLFLKKCFQKYFSSYHRITVTERKKLFQSNKKLITQKLNREKNCFDGQFFKIFKIHFSCKHQQHVIRRSLA